MANATTNKSDDTETKSTEVKKQAREIKGNLPYVASPTAIPKVLSALVEAERPEKFTINWMDTVLGLTGGANKAVPPFMKKMGLLSSDGTPTERYSRFKTDSGRAQAAYEGLQDAFSELFRKNEVAHRADENKIKDLIVEITGLTSSDNIVRLIYNSFDVVRALLPKDFVPGKSSREVGFEYVDESHGGKLGESNIDINVERQLGLSYHINLVLPETDNQAVLDAIFKSIKRNLL